MSINSKILFILSLQPTISLIEFTMVNDMSIVSVIVIFVILFIVALTTKTKSNVFLAFGLIDIFLRLMDYIGKHTISEVNNIIKVGFLA